MSNVYYGCCYLPTASRRRGEDGPAFQGNFRKGELRGIIHINKDNCVGCDTCRKFCPVDAISGGLGAIHKIRDDACVSCGQCLSACRSRHRTDELVDDVIAALKDPKKFVVAHPSPAVRVALAEEFGGKPGDLCTDQMLNALEKAGFTVYDVNQTADQTILEEGTEFIKKVRYWCLGERSPEVNMMAQPPAAFTSPVAAPAGSEIWKLTSLLRFPMFPRQRARFRWAVL